MSGAENPHSKSFLGVLYGCALGAIVFLAPVVGVRRGWNELLSHWAELCVFASCVLAGGLIVGRWMVAHKLEQLERLEATSQSNDLDAAQLESTALSMESAIAPSSVTQEVDLAEVNASATEGVNREEANLDVTNERTVVEKSESESTSITPEKLTGTAATAVVVRGKEREQTKVEKRIRLIVSPERTKRTAGFVFLLLYINCAVLCQRLNFGMFSLPGSVASLLSIIGVTLTILGALYIAMYDKLAANHRVQHPNYFGVLVILLGVPFVFSTWFPLVALPGTFVGMLWSLKKPSADTVLTAPPSPQTRKLIPFVY